MTLVTHGEKILHNAVMAAVSNPSSPSYGAMREALVEYADAKTMKAFRWNDPADWKENEGAVSTKIPIHSGEVVRPPWAKIQNATYNQVSDILGTAGCGKEHPYYCWSVMGIIEDDHGKQTVSPGDWVVEIYEGRLIVMPHDQFVSMFVE